MKRKSPSPKRYVVTYEKDGVELERYEIEADTLADAEEEAFTRFHQAHPRLPIFGRNAGLTKRVEVSQTDTPKRIDPSAPSVPAGGGGETGSSL